MVLWYPNYQDKYIYNIYIIFTEYLKYTTSIMYSINKYKLLRHTLVSNNHGSAFQTPSSHCLNKIDLNFQEKSVQSCIVAPPRGASLLLISVLVSQQLGVIMYTTIFYSRTWSWLDLHGSQTRTVPRWPLDTPNPLLCRLLFADSCSSRPGGVSTLLLTPILSCSIYKEEGAKVGGSRS